MAGNDRDKKKKQNLKDGQSQNVIHVPVRMRSRIKLLKLDQ